MSSSTLALVVVGLAWAVLRCNGTPVRVITTTLPQYGNASSWHIDDGSVIYGRFVDVSRGRHWRAHIVMEYMVHIPDGHHQMYAFGDGDNGWHGGYWEIRHMDETYVAGGERMGLVTGSGSETEFCIGVQCANFVNAPQVPVVVHIHAGTTGANEIVWSIDDGHYFGVSPVLDPSDADFPDYYYHETLTVGQHTMHYIDSHANGWDGGWWEIRSGDIDGPIIVGGEADSHGVVEGAGGELTFTLTADGMGQSGEVRGVELVVHTGLGASTLIIQIDNLPPFIPEGGFDDHMTYNFPVAVAEGPHTIYYYDTWGGGATASGHKDVVFVLDDSGSMATNHRLQTCKQSLDGMFAEVGGKFNNHDRVGFVPLNADPIPLQEYADMRSDMMELIVSMYPTGGTPLWTKMGDAIQMLLDAPVITNDRWIVALTDGHSSDQPSTVRDALRTASGSNIHVIFITVDLPNDGEMMQIIHDTVWRSNSDSILRANGGSSALMQAWSDVGERLLLPSEVALREPSYWEIWEGDCEHRSANGSCLDALEGPLRVPELGNQIFYLLEESASITIDEAGIEHIEFECTALGLTGVGSSDDSRCEAAPGCFQVANPESAVQLQNAFREADVGLFNVCVRQHDGDRPQCASQEDAQTSAQCSTGGVDLHESGSINLGWEQYTTNQDCRWRLHCTTGSPHVTFSSFDTEANFDFLNVYDSDCYTCGNPDSRLHGNAVPEDFVGSGSVVAMQFVSDGSVNRAGFSASFTCGTFSTSQQTSTSGLYRGACRAPEEVSQETHGPSSTPRVRIAREQMAGDGGETDFCIGSMCDEQVAYGHVKVTLHVTRGDQDTDRGCEMKWNVDSGQYWDCSELEFQQTGEFWHTLLLPVGDHTIHAVDLFGDGWHPGGYWELLPGEVHTGHTGVAAIAGGPERGTVSGSGTTVVVALNIDGTGTVSDATGVVVIIDTQDHANEIMWKIDDGTHFFGHADFTHERDFVRLHPGQHTIFYYDSGNDGWSGGWWEVRGVGLNGEHIAGGNVSGLVSGAGGQTTFCFGGEVCAQFEEPLQVPVTVHIRTRTNANEMRWSIDRGHTFGVIPPLENNENYWVALNLTTGEHSMNCFDSYSDGWHGGYWEIYAGAVQPNPDDESVPVDPDAHPFAGGQSEEWAVHDSGGDIAFRLDANGTGTASQESAEVLMEIHTAEYASDIWWNFDIGDSSGDEAISFGRIQTQLHRTDGPQTVSQYQDYEIYRHNLTLSFGTHVVYVVDGTGDGWHGGYWSLLDGCGHLVAGGAQAGRVQGRGGEQRVAIGEETQTCSFRDECISTPCEHSGTCIDGLLEYMCDCVAGFEGTNCENDKNECASGPCRNGGQCHDDTFMDGSAIPADNYQCNCRYGWTGDNCENDADECVSEPCQHGSVCYDLFRRYNCTCAPGYEGMNCARDSNECDSDPCEHDGSSCDESSTSAEVVIDEYFCTCVAGYAGDNCATDVDECASSPCWNGTSITGRCVDGLSSYYCECEQGWSGTNCALEINPCTENDEICDSHATCTHTGPGAHDCTCRPGFNDTSASSDGTNCTDVDECASNPCVNGTCTEDFFDSDRTIPALTYTCGCAAGYHGHNCAEDVDECASHPCNHDGNCTESLSGDVNVGEYTCSCRRGYNGVNCEIDIDECASNPCLHDVQCVDHPDEYECICAHGWAGPQCANQTNLCELGQDNCDREHGTCQHTGPGEFVCHCDCGFHPVNGGEDCTEIDECSSEPCDHGECIEGLSRYDCECDSGYVGANCATDFDECSSTPCIHGDCEELHGDQIGRYTCHCNPGYIGEECQHDRDECASNPCDHSANCTESGSANSLVSVDEYLCTCRYGFYGVNCAFDRDECQPIPCGTGECEQLHGDHIGHYECNCLAGYDNSPGQQNCRIDIDECYSHPCDSLSNSTCIESNTNADRGGNPVIDVDDYMCLCADGFAGENCDDVDECSEANLPCENGAKCVNTYNSYDCECVTGWVGDNCDLHIVPCVHYEEQACASHSECFHLGPGIHNCSCYHGYEPMHDNAWDFSSGNFFLSGINCTNVDECSSGPCHNGGTCHDDVSCRDDRSCRGEVPLTEFRCDCRDGYTGGRCQEDIDECDSDPCENWLSCIESRRIHDETDERGRPLLASDGPVVDADAYVCVCQEYFYGANCDAECQTCATGHFVVSPCGTTSTEVTLPNGTRLIEHHVAQDTVCAQCPQFNESTIEQARASTYGEAYPDGYRMYSADGGECRTCFPPRVVNGDGECTRCDLGSVLQNDNCVSCSDQCRGCIAVNDTHCSSECLHPEVPNEEHTECGLCVPALAHSGAYVEGFRGIAEPVYGATDDFLGCERCENKRQEDKKFYSHHGVCIECPPPYVVNKRHVEYSGKTYEFAGVACVACPEGKVRSDDGSDCLECESEDMYTELGECRVCNAPNVMGKACRPPFTCPAGQYCAATTPAGDQIPPGGCVQTSDCTSCPVGRVSTIAGDGCDMCDAEGERANDDQTACTSCVPGTMPAGNRSTCVPCSGTSYSKYGIDCLPCPYPNVVPRNQDSQHPNIDCIACTPGTGPSSDQLSCEQCTGGNASKYGVCTPCNDKAPKANHTECGPCPLNGQIAVDGICGCKVGYYRAKWASINNATQVTFNRWRLFRCYEHLSKQDYSPDHFSHTSDECVSCADLPCLDCSSGGRVAIRPGFAMDTRNTDIARNSATSFHDVAQGHIPVFRCKLGVTACTGDFASPCNPGYKGLLCDQCEDTHKKTRIADDDLLEYQRQCANGRGSMCWARDLHKNDLKQYCVPFRHLSGDQSGETLFGGDVDCTQGRLLGLRWYLPVFAGPVAVVVLYAMSGSSAGAQSLSVLAILLKISMCVAQIFAQLPELFAIDYPGQFRAVVECIKICFDMLAVVDVGCMDYWDQFWLACGFSLYVFGIIFACDTEYYIESLQAVYSKRPSQNKLRSTRTTKMKLAAAFLVYPQVSLVIFKGARQTCRRVGESESFLSVDLAISCEGRYYNEFTDATPNGLLILLFSCVWTVWILTNAACSNRAGASPQETAPSVQAPAARSQTTSNPVHPGTSTVATFENDASNQRSPSSKVFVDRVEEQLKNDAVTMIFLYAVLLTFIAAVTKSWWWWGLMLFPVGIPATTFLLVWKDRDKIFPLKDPSDPTSDRLFRMAETECTFDQKTPWNSSIADLLHKFNLLYYESLLRHTWDKDKKDRYELRRVIGVEMLDNPKLKGRYDAYTTTLPIPNEQLLFHGCAESALSKTNPQSIVAGGFLKQFQTSSAGTWQRYGPGFYFATQASKSHEYPLPTYNPKNGTLAPGVHTRRMLLCKVALGKVKETTKNMDTLTTTGPPGYDSVYGKADKNGSLNFDERVVYREEAVLPYAIVEYEFEKKDPQNLNALAQSSQPAMQQRAASAPNSLSFTKKEMVYIMPNWVGRFLEKHFHIQWMQYVLIIDPNDGSSTKALHTHFGLSAVQTGGQAIQLLKVQGENVHGRDGLLYRERHKHPGKDPVECITDYITEIAREQADTGNSFVLTLGTIPNETYQKYSFVLDGYKQDFYYWDTVEMARKIAFVGIVSFYGLGSMQQLTVATIIQGMFAILCAYTQPFDAGETSSSRAPNITKVYFEAMLLFTLCLTIVQKAVDLDTADVLDIDESFVGTLLVLQMFPFIVLGALVVLYTLLHRCESKPDSAQSNVSTPGASHISVEAHGQPVAPENSQYQSNAQAVCGPYASMTGAQVQAQQIPSAADNERYSDGVTNHHPYRGGNQSVEAGGDTYSNPIAAANSGSHTSGNQSALTSDGNGGRQGMDVTHLVQRQSEGGPANEDANFATDNFQASSSTRDEATTRIQQQRQLDPWEGQDIEIAAAGQLYCSHHHTTAKTFFFEPEPEPEFLTNRHASGAITFSQLEGHAGLDDQDV